MPDVCRDIVELADKVKEIAILLATIREADKARDEKLAEHREWLTAHQALIERVATSETDRKALHAQLDGLTGTLKWAVGIGVTIALAIIGIQSSLWLEFLRHVAAGIAGGAK